MKALGLSARIRRKRKYYSYQGEVGMKAENLIQRQFEASKPMEKCYVTELSTSKNDVGTSLHREVLWEHYSA